VGRWQPLLEQLARERYGRLLSLALLVAPDRSGAQDLVQDALVATFSGRARFESIAQAEAYVRRAIVTRSANARRSGAIEARALAAVAARAALVTGPAAEPMDPRVLAALRDLPPRERACVVLRHVEDLSVRDTAAALGLSEGAVKRYVSDGVAALNAALGTTAPRTQSMPVRTGGEHDA